MKRQYVLLRWLLATCFLLVAGGNVLAQESPRFSVGAYQLVSSKRIDRFHFDYVYRAELTNSGLPASQVAAVLQTDASGVEVVQGQLDFGEIQSAERIVSPGSFTIRHDRRLAYSEQDLQWRFSATDASDADADGISDNAEAARYGTDPANPDTDSDTLTDGDELFRLGTNPRNADTDGDGISDADEIAAGSDPLDGATGTGYLFHYTVTGLEGSGGALNLILVDRPCFTANPCISGEFPAPLDGNFTHTVAGVSVVDGQNYWFSVDRNPDNPLQRCLTTDIIQSVNGHDVEELVECHKAYRLHYTVTGLTGSGGQLLLKASAPETGPETNVVSLSANGEFSFDDLLLLANSNYELSILQQPASPNQECKIDHPTGVSADQDIYVNIDCQNAYRFKYSVDGMAGGSGELELTIFAPDNCEQAENCQPQTFRAPLSGNGTFDVANAVATTGQTYSYQIIAHPSSPAQICVFDRGFPFISNKVETQDVTEHLACSPANNIEYVVEGLKGSGAKLGMSVIGPDVFSSVFHYDLTGDGSFIAEGATVLPGFKVNAVIEQPPANPEQQCSFDNGKAQSDVITAGTGNVSMKITCKDNPPFRSWRFDTTLTRHENEPVQGGSLNESIVLDDAIIFPRGPAVPLGQATGLDALELFHADIDRPGATLTVHSNETGKTYWLVAESPDGQGITKPIGQSHLGTLVTTWHFRKDSANAEFKLEVSQFHALAYADKLFADHSILRAGASISVHAHRLVNGEPLDTPFYAIEGGVYLTGIKNPAYNENSPPGTPFVSWGRHWDHDFDVPLDLWFLDDFTLDPQKGDPLQAMFPFQAAYMQLIQPKTINIDLSGIPVGEEVVIVSDAQVHSQNGFSMESGSAVFLRDPATIDPGNPESAVGVVAVSGLTPLSMDGIATDNLKAGGGPSPAACTAPESERSVLAFELGDYTVGEIPEYPANYREVQITREGNLSGLVTATVRLSGGSATAGQDFEDRTFEVRFGDGAGIPRTLELPILDDTEVEPNETLTLTLEAPQGCAVIGTQRSAAVTIVDDDALRPGQLVFGTDRLSVDEAAGSASLTVERIGNTAGVLTATVDVQGVTAATGVDFGLPAANIRFEDGESGPKTLLVPIVDDRFTEADETFSVTLGGGNEGNLNQATVTIVDNDANQANTVQFGAVPADVAEAGGSIRVEVTRYGGSSGAVSVTVSSADGSATAGSDYQNVQAVVNFADGDMGPKYLDVAILNDTLLEGNESFTLALSDPQGAIALDVPDSVQITIVDDDTGGWSTPNRLDPSATANANTPEVSVGASGDALVIWKTTGGIVARSYNPVNGWAEPLPVATTGDLPAAAVDGNGNAMAIWGDTPLPASSRYLNGSGWQAPEAFSQVAGESFRIAVNNDGTGAAVWREPINRATGNLDPDIWMARFDATGWFDPVQLDSGSVYGNDPDVAVDDLGNIMAVWEQSLNIYTAYYDAVTGDLAVGPLANTGIQPKVAMNAAGDALVAWRYRTGVGEHVRVNYFDNATRTWLGERQLDGDNEQTTGAKPALDALGNGLQLWDKERPDHVNWSIWSNRFDRATQTWSAEQLVSAGPAPVVPGSMHSAVDADGNLLAVWEEISPDRNGYLVRVNRYDAATDSWDTPLQLGNQSAFRLYPKVAADGQGNAIAVWQEAVNGLSAIFYAQFSKP